MPDISVDKASSISPVVNKAQKLYDAAMKIIDGKAIAQQIQQELASAIRAHASQRQPCLAVILVGNHRPSQIYVNRKMEACGQIGIKSIRHHLPDTATEQTLLELIAKLNNDPSIDGILLQLPLPHHFNSIQMISAISPQKDVDGLHPTNMGKLLIGDPSGFVPCTPLGIKVLLQRAMIDITGKHLVVVGRSNLVGKPVAALLMQNTPGANATVTILHSYSKDAPEILRSADILVVAMGSPKFLTHDLIKEGVGIIDVGINSIETPNGRKLVGDVDFEAVKDKCSFITPVPGGVGPMTIAMLMSNTWKSYSS